jgi:Uma2 family endonuclease
MVQQLTSPPVVPGRWYPMTFEEFLDWAPSEGRAEWVDGWGMVYVGTTIRHGLMVQFSSDLFSGYLRLFDLGVIFTQQIVMHLPTRPSGRMPDIMVVLREHQDRLGKRWFEGPADFVAEFVSESEPDVDLVEKRAEYQAAGVPEYLAVDTREDRHGFWWHRLGPEQRYEPIEPDAAGRYQSTVLPGFWLDPRWFAQEPLPDPNRCLFEIAPEAYRRYQRRLLGEE